MEELAKDCSLLWQRPLLYSTILLTLTSCFSLLAQLAIYAVKYSYYPQDYQTCTHLSSNHNKNDRLRVLSNNVPSHCIPVHRIFRRHLDCRYLQYPRFPGPMGKDSQSI